MGVAVAVCECDGGGAVHCYNRDLGRVGLVGVGERMGAEVDSSRSVASDVGNFADRLQAHVKKTVNVTRAQCHVVHNASHTLHLFRMVLFEVADHVCEYGGVAFAFAPEPGVQK